MVHFTPLPKGALPTDDVIETRLSELDSALVNGELFAPAQIRTIRSGKVVLNGGYQIIAAESGTTGDLDTIIQPLVVVTPKWIVLQADTGDTITLKNGTGNIETRSGLDIVMTGTDKVALFWDGTQYVNLTGGRVGDIGVRAFGAVAGQSIPDDTETLVTVFTGTEHFDTDEMHSVTINTGRITINIAGKYDIDAHINFSPPNATGYREVTIRLNGTTDIAQLREKSRGSVVVTSMQVSTIYDLAIGDYVEVYVRHTKGSAQNIANLNFAANIFFAKLLAR